MQTVGLRVKRVKKVQHLYSHGFQATKILHGMYTAYKMSSSTTNQHPHYITNVLLYETWQHPSLQERLQIQFNKNSTERCNVNDEGDRLKLE